MRSVRTGITLTALAIFVGCGGDSPTQTGTAPLPSVGITVATNALSIGQGVGDSVAMSITRGNYAGSISLTTEGAPAGVTATFVPPLLEGSATSTKLVLGIAPTTPPGVYPLTVRLTGSGMTPQAVNLALTVVAPKISFQFCADAAPVFFAAQDNTGAWIAIQPDSSARFAFNITNKGAIAYVIGSGVSFTTTVEYGTRDELRQEGAAACVNSSGTAVLTATAAGVAAGDISRALIGQGSGANRGNGAFSILSVSLGIHDLLATVRPTQDDNYIPTKFILRRNVTVAGSGPIPVLDFASSEAFTPATATVTVSNAGDEVVGAVPTYYTANSGGRIPVQNGYFADAVTTRSYVGIPTAQQKAGDFNALGVGVSAQDMSYTRGVTTFFTAVANKTVSVGPVPNQPTISAVNTPSTSLPTAQWTGQHEYGQYFTAAFAQFPGNSATIFASSGYEGDIGMVKIAMPDLSSVGGWSKAYGLTPGTLTRWNTGAFSADFPIDRMSTLKFSIDDPPPSATAGGTLVFGTRGGTFTP